MLLAASFTQSKDANQKAFLVVLLFMDETNCWMYNRLLKDFATIVIAFVLMKFQLVKSTEHPRLCFLGSGSILGPTKTRNVLTIVHTQYFFFIAASLYITYCRQDQWCGVCLANSLNAQDCISGRAFRVGFELRPGSDLKLKKISCLMRAWHMLFV